MSFKRRFLKASIVLFTWMVVTGGYSTFSIAAAFEQQLCEEIDWEYVGHISLDPIHLQQLGEIQYQETYTHNLKKIQGQFGEAAAQWGIQEYVRFQEGEIYLSPLQQKTFYESGLVSIVTIFQEMGCQVEPMLRDRGDRGIDDIFLVETYNWGRRTWEIDWNHAPIFHESKYSTSCHLKLSKTKTMCQQMSIQWLTRNMNLTNIRTGQAAICYGKNGHGLIIKSCEECRKVFQSLVVWLWRQLKAQKFYRTASVLCPESQRIDIYQIYS